MAITAAKRRSLPLQEFGLPEKRGYPLDTAGRARSALSRASANATPQQQTRIRRKVAELYPGIKQAGKLRPLSSMAA